MNDLRLPPLSMEELAKSDEELGMWLMATWLGHQALKRGIPLDAIPTDWAEAVVNEASEVDTDSTANVALEKALRKAAKGDFVAAGALLRALTWGKAHAIVEKKYAALGVKQQLGRKRGGQKAGATKRAEAAEWHERCRKRAQELLSTGTNPRDIAGMLARTFKVTPKAVRAVLRKGEAN